MLVSQQRFEKVPEFYGISYLILHIIFKQINHATL